jgi:hypothetical protein
MLSPLQRAEGARNNARQPARSPWGKGGAGVDIHPRAAMAPEQHTASTRSPHLRGTLIMTIMEPARLWATPMLVSIFRMRFCDAICFARLESMERCSSCRAAKLR